MIKCELARKDGMAFAVLAEVSQDSDAVGTYMVYGVKTKKAVAITNVTPLMGAPDVEKEDVATLKKAVKDFIAEGAS